MVEGKGGERRKKRISRKRPNGPAKNEEIECGPPYDSSRANSDMHARRNAPWAGSCMDMHACMDEQTDKSEGKGTAAVFCSALGLQEGMQGRGRDLEAITSAAKSGEAQSSLIVLRILWIAEREMA
ncbi:hypothetical protein CISG_04269 [Coccidioides immitis RMSCC 3703]|uniref:Uncharacterized protein n=2 Tax=Coccidioides immitis TaxID=5501 RepID=A0A0J8TLL2_COCIT|nr:hypothetical protein CIRG_02329 [Coccidioides immitis RMSCC 2394]KMU74562.1 hypothetical protein CISG_04269 [Coccidioides immitis RMSCC 3703]